MEINNINDIFDLISTQNYVCRIQNHKLKKCDVVRHYAFKHCFTNLDYGK